jgi:hypothetical protein
MIVSNGVFNNVAAYLVSARIVIFGEFTICLKRELMMKLWMDIVETILFDKKHLRNVQKLLFYHLLVV